MKWYEQRYVSHRDWILDQLEVLGLSEKEVIIVLLIDFLNEHQQEISLDLLHRKTGWSTAEVDQVISVLCARKDMEIRASSQGVRVLLDGLFETDTARDQRILDTPLFDVFETEFGRPLTQKEMQKISDWNRTADRRMILYALREASGYQKKNIGYVESVLNAWLQKGCTPEMIEEGRTG